MISCCELFRPDAPPERAPADDVLAGALDPATWAWIQAADTDAAELRRVAEEFELHELAIEDAIEAGQRSKIERYDQTLVAVLRPARRGGEGELVFDEILIAVGDQFVLTVGHGEVEPLLDRARQRLERATAPPREPIAVLHALADLVVDDYALLVTRSERMVLDVERDVFSAEAGEDLSQRLYTLKREVLELWHAAEPLVRPLDRLVEGRSGVVDDDARDYLRDVDDHLKHVVARLATQRDLLTDAFDVNVARIGVRQNEDMRRLSGWAALFLLPSVLVGLWGMNFTHMPELDAWWGYPAALAVIVGSCLALGLWLRRSGWL